MSAMYGRLWRWHFFSALLVIPFVLWQAVTGTMYLWHREIALANRPELLTVETSAQRVSYDEQLRAAMRVGPRDALPEVLVEDDPRRSTVFLFTAANGLSYPTFVDPHSGDVLGTIAPWAWLGGWSRSLHGGWPLGQWGSYLLEIGAGWTIVMILTGLYLWWPRGASSIAGVLYPRLRQGNRIFWRDVHATVGVWFAAIVLLFLLTALPWTAFWGERLLGAVQTASGQYSPAGRFFGGGHQHEASAMHGTLPSLAQIVEASRAAGAAGRLEIRLASHGNTQVRSQTGRSPADIYLEFDADAALVRREGWSEMTAIPRAVALGVDLHQGSYFGRANQVLNTAVAGSLVWLAVTGFMGWLRRRPDGKLAAPPPKREQRLATGVKLAAVLACIAMPLFGLSVLVVALLDLIFGRVLRQSAACACD